MNGLLDVSRSMRFRLCAESAGFALIRVDRMEKGMAFALVACGEMAASAAARDRMRRCFMMTNNFMFMVNPHGERASRKMPIKVMMMCVECCRVKHAAVPWVTNLGGKQLLIDASYITPYT